MTELAVRVSGRPAPQGSHDQGENGYLLNSSKYLAAWRAAVNRDTRKAYLAAGLTGRDMPMIEYPAPVHIHLLELIVLDEQCRADGTDESTGAPDLDKLLRATIDGLGEARVFTNDSQVTKVHELGKRRALPGEPSGALIIISDRPPAEREIAHMDTTEYRISLERVGRDADGDRTYETVIEAYGSAERIGAVMPTVGIMLGVDVTIGLQAELEPALEQPAAAGNGKATRGRPRKAAATPAEPAPAAPAAPAEPSAPAAAAVEPQAPAQPPARVNPFAN